jgi:hypothetical protein
MSIMTAAKAPVAGRGVAWPLRWGRGFVALR